MTAGKRTHSAGYARAALRGRTRQRGLTLFGLLFWALAIGFGAYLVIRVFPTVNEYLTIKSTVEKIAAQQPPTVAEVRAAFDRQKEVEYSITSISGKDLEVTKENDRVVVGFAYDKLIPIYGSVYILVKYEGRSK
ncbi:DUF4845 domain-containing protein [Rubrivivax rivuli]|uniref:DUF4845 domain-containing protein n=1 Tax=Rubrivivax rivuli TaxID=1862385 RepID=A0A437RC29_9BURK|nr:DUF4845 domain-containing protein [Rubrivivax rivuli]RVU44224.1 DUF4845 domain-containing protein [Rubrivivax rivuli]